MDYEQRARLDCFLLIWIASTDKVETSGCRRGTQSNPGWHTYF